MQRSHFDCCLLFGSHHQQAAAAALTMLASLKQQRVSWFILAVMLAGIFLPVLREILTKDDLEWKDFYFLFDISCNPLYILNYDVCDVWPAYPHLAAFFLFAAPLVLLNHDLRDLFTRFPAVIGGFQAFRTKILGFSAYDTHSTCPTPYVPNSFPHRIFVTLCSGTIQIEALSRQVTIAVHPSAPHIAVAAHADVKSIHLYKAERAVPGQPNKGKRTLELKLDNSFWNSLGCDSAAGASAIAMCAPASCRHFRASSGIARYHVTPARCLSHRAAGRGGRVMPGHCWSAQAPT